MTNREGMKVSKPDKEAAGQERCKRITIMINNNNCQKEREQAGL